ncbi:MAG: hypothetical protein R8K20_00700 [Gallionellaceae bacterium]
MNCWLNTDNSLAPSASSFPRKRESSQENIPRSGQGVSVDPLRGEFLICWIPAFAGMTVHLVACCFSEMGGISPMTAHLAACSELASSSTNDDSCGLVDLLAPI